MVCVCDDRGSSQGGRAVAGAPYSGSPETIVWAPRCPSLTVGSRGANVFTWAPMSYHPISENKPGQPRATGLSSRPCAASLPSLGPQGALEPLRSPRPSGPVLPVGAQALEGTPHPTL